CYTFTSEPAAFALAEQNCINQGGHLVSISNAFENDVISDNAKTALTSTTASDFWTGASDLVTTGKWAWTDGSNFQYTNWGSGTHGIV
ncbi:lectin C-type domain protein, partial [Necator americanus]